MKTLFRTILALSALILTAAGCSEEPLPVEAEAPVLVSVSPEDGATDLEGTTLTVQVKFDRNVIAPAASCVSIEPAATIKSMDAHDKGLFISLEGLENGESYKLTIKPETILSYQDKVAYPREIGISFTMKYTPREYVWPRNPSTSLSDSHATDAASRLYSFLLDNYGQKTISGAMGSTAWTTEFTDMINTAAGRYPAIIGFDYLFNNWPAKAWAECPDYNDISVIKKAWESHNIIQIGWHWNVPKSGQTTDPGNYSFYSQYTSFSITEALKEGTWQREEIDRQIKQIAGFLSLIQDAGIPVIWRPLHEAAGDYTWGAWFWWGKGGAEACKQLWRYMYDSFTNKYGLHNLIWVWTAQTSDKGKLADVEKLQEWYPGDDCVDIVGADLYVDKGTTQSQAFKLVNASVEGRKMVALSEFGNLLDFDGAFEEDAPWLYFMNWSTFENGTPVLYCKNSDGTYSWNNTSDDWKKALAGSRVINRNNVPAIASYESPDAGWQKAADAVKRMKTGWNLGNTLDSCGDWIENKGTSSYETAWGQPVTRPELIKMFADAGFGAIRVPVTWYQHMDAAGNVDKAWMDRVEQVVNYVLDAGLYCILNVHHDTGTDGWLHADAGVYSKVSGRYITLWKQIAERFKNYGEKLLFEGFNEMLDINNYWNAPKLSTSYLYINNFNRDFVETVRATGGNNEFRNLVLTDYCSSSQASAFEALDIPEDRYPGHLIAEFHSYSPYQFAMGEQKEFDQAADNEVRNQIRTIAQIAANKGVPCIIGEYGCTADREEYQIAKQASCYISEARKYDICCFYWMLLSDGKDRDVPKWTHPEVKNAIINALK